MYKPNQYAAFLIANGLCISFLQQTELKQQENYDILISTFEEEKAYDFYTITPILQYSKNGQDYFYNMHDVIYGVLIPDEEKIQKIIN